MVWWYYYCQHGPGHQSTTDDFFEVPDYFTKKHVKAHLDHLLSDLDWPITHFWKLDVISLDFYKKKLKSAERELKDLQERAKELRSRIRLLKAQNGNELGESYKTFDREVMTALTKRHTESVMKELHKEGITVSYDTVYRWGAGVSSPNKNIRDKVLSCANRSKKFFSAEFSNGKEKRETKAEWVKNVKRLVDYRIEQIERMSKFK